MSLGEIVIANGVTQGDIHRIARDKNEGKNINDEDLKKELGNTIFSTIRWCDDLGFDPEECIELSIKAQKSYQRRK
jgi:hypothetical protein